MWTCYVKLFKIHEIKYGLKQLQLQLLHMPNYKKAAIGIG